MHMFILFPMAILYYYSLIISYAILMVCVVVVFYCIGFYRHFGGSDFLFAAERIAFHAINLR